MTVLRHCFAEKYAVGIVDTELIHLIITVANYRTCNAFNCLIDTWIFDIILHYPFIRWITSVIYSMANNLTRNSRNICHYRQK